VVHVIVTVSPATFEVESIERFNVGPRNGSDPALTGVHLTSTKSLVPLSQKIPYETLAGTLRVTTRAPEVPRSPAQSSMPKPNTRQLDTFDALHSNMIGVLIGTVRALALIFTTGLVDGPHSIWVLDSTGFVVPQRTV